MSRAGFMPHEDVTNALIIEKGIIDRQHCAAGIAEYMVDTLPDQTFDQYVCAAALLTHSNNPSKFAVPFKRTDPGRQ